MWRSTLAPRSMAFQSLLSSGRWLRPPLEGMKSMPASVINARFCASCPAPDGIRLVCVSPGVIDTPMTDKAIAGSADPAAYAATQADPYPLGRIGRAEEIAAVVAFLASDEAGWITGVSWSVDGGVTA